MKRNQTILFIVVGLIEAIIIVYFSVIPSREVNIPHKSGDETIYTNVSITISDESSRTTATTIDSPAITEPYETEDNHKSETSEKDGEILLPDIETFTPTDDTGQHEESDAEPIPITTAPLQDTSAPETTESPKATTSIIPEITVLPVEKETAPLLERYKCGSENHKCQNEEYHIYLHNMELQGCKYCGLHSCQSFYATNEWGFTKYDATKCPKYTVQKDPAKYCANCGREMWSKDNPSGCFSYLLDTLCECGEYVKGNICHHH